MAPTLGHRMDRAARKAWTRVLMQSLFMIWLAGCTASGPPAQPSNAEPPGTTAAAGGTAAVDAVGGESDAALQSRVETDSEPAPYVDSVIVEGGGSRVQVPLSQIVADADYVVEVLVVSQGPLRYNTSDGRPPRETDPPQPEVNFPGRARVPIQMRITKVYKAPGALPEGFLAMPIQSGDHPTVPARRATAGTKAIALLELWDDPAATEPASVTVQPWVQYQESLVAQLNRPGSTILPAIVQGWYAIQEPFVLDSESHTDVFHSEFELELQNILGIATSTPP